MDFTSKYYLTIIDMFFDFFILCGNQMIKISEPHIFVINENDNNQIVFT
jgi:hypothetical protein